MSSSRDRSRSPCFRRFARLREVSEAAVLRRVAPDDSGFWLPMLSKSIFGAPPSFFDLRLARLRRRVARLVAAQEEGEDLHAHFDRAQVLWCLVCCYYHHCICIVRCASFVFVFCSWC